MDPCFSPSISLSSCVCTLDNSSVFTLDDESALEATVQRALRSGGGSKTIVIRSSIRINIPQTVIIKDNDVDITIISDSYISLLPASSPSEMPSSPRRVEIVGNGHSVFQVTGKRSRLTLVGLDIFHSMHDDDKTKIGGVVFAMGSSFIKLCDCDIISEFGFGAWCVQRASCSLTSCRVRSVSRSGCVAFGQSKLQLQSAEIHECFQHGVCLRGNCTLQMSDSSITDCGVRAIYAYESAIVLLNKCVIRGTKSRLHGAIELRGVKAPRHLPGPYSSNGSTQEEKSKTKSTGLSNDKLQRKGKHVSALERGNAVTLADLVGKRVMFDSNAGPSLKLSGPVSVLVSDSMVYDPFTGSCVAFNDMCPLPRLQRFTMHRFHCSYTSESMDRESCNDYEFGRNQKMVWYYERYDDNWVEYSPSMSIWLSIKYYEVKNKLESSPQQVCLAEHDDVLLGVIVTPPPPLDTYEIDFCKMMQRNKSTFFERPIRYCLIAE